MRLSAAIETYVHRKRDAGLQFEKGEQILASFSRCCGNRPLDALNTRHIAAFLNRPTTGTATWRHKYGLLKHFFDFWSARDEMPPVLMPPSRPEERTTFIPYIYPRQEVRNLLRKTRLNQRASLTVDASTLRTLLLFLYATGARLGEAADLKLSDVDLRSGRVTFRGTRFNRKRCIPIAPDLLTAMQIYVKATLARRGEESHFFIRNDGSRICIRTLNNMFSDLRNQAGIVRSDGSIYQPRMHDLRSTFAVHRMPSWIKEGRDLNRMLPALSAYIGQVGLISTERYLSLTPERFRKELDKLSPKKSKKRWRNDARLMKFLAKL